MTWGLALSGGVAYGLANAGVLEVLEREKLRPDYIAGSSMGAVIAALYACGCSTHSFRDLGGNLSLRSIARFSKEPFKDGIFGGLLRQQFADILQPLIGDKRIQDADIPLTIVAGKVKSPLEWQQFLTRDFTNHVLERIERYVFPPETRIMDALYATTSIPIVFAPTEIHGELFVDLCTFGAIPSRALQANYDPDIMIATKTVPKYAALRRISPPSLKRFLEASNKSMEKEVLVCDLVIEPHLPGTILSFHKALDFMDEGKKVTEKALPKIRSLLQS